jgi:hypothetical protein
METKGASINDMMRKLDLEPAPKPAAPQKPRIVYVPAPTPTPGPQVPLPVAVPKKPDTAVVQVYRGAAVTEQKMAKKDTTKRDTLPN